MFLLLNGQAPKPICREHLTVGPCPKCAAIRRQAFAQARRFAREIERAKAVAIARLG